MQGPDVILAPMRPSCCYNLYEQTQRLHTAICILICSGEGGSLRLINDSMKVHRSLTFHWPHSSARVTWAATCNSSTGDRRQNKPFMFFQKKIKEELNMFPLSNFLMTFVDKRRSKRQLSLNLSNYITRKESCRTSPVIVYTANKLIERAFVVWGVLCVVFAWMCLDIPNAACLDSTFAPRCLSNKGL